MVALCLAVCLPCFAQKQATPKKPRPVYLRRERTILLLGKAPFRNIGVNLPTLFSDCLQDNTKPVEELLVRAKAAGVRFVRCSRILGSAESLRLLEADPERWHAAFARTLTLTDAQGLYLIPTLLPRYDTLISAFESPTPSGSAVNSLMQQGGERNSRIVSAVRAIVTRHKDDTRILFWEVADGWNREAEEPNKPTTDAIARFLTQMATAIKQSDKKHLVSSGNAEVRPDASHRKDKKTGLDSFAEYTVLLAEVNPLPLDFVSVQQYPPGEESPLWLVRIDDAALILPWTRNVAERTNRPLFVAEFGSHNPFLANTASAKWLIDFLKRLQAGMAPLACIAQSDFEDTETVRLLAEANASILVEVTAESQSRR